jgi:glycosyltransferase involved in cell wall biosynthesis
MTVFITICARNYVALAITLGKSVKRHHPDAAFVIWLLDEGPVKGLPEGLRVCHISKALEPEVLTELLLFYNVRELATAVKPHCLAAELADGAERVIYLDPDILVFRPFTETLNLLDEGATGVLTPHILEPLPWDGAKPNELELLGAGVYNLGFLGLARSDDASAFLKWWGSWLRQHCFEDKSTGTFTDQKWVNFAPAFWPGFQVLRDPTYNVAYWNLPQRKLRSSGTDWLVEGNPLTFFHFSGFDPSRPEVLSKHQNRIDVLPWTALAKLLAHYANLLAEEDHEHRREINFPPVRFANGMIFDDICRRLYRDASGVGMRFRELLAAGPGTFYDWVQERLETESPPENVPAITRYMHRVYTMRPDVMREYPDVFGNDREGFLHWLRGSGVSEMGINPDFIPASHPASSPRLICGVNYVGYLRSDLGLGEAARGNITAIEKHGWDVVLVDVSRLAGSTRNCWRIDDEMAALDAGKAHEINIIHVNADQLLLARDHLGSGFFQGRYNIGVWAWETPRFPREWSDRFGLLDEIWVGGTFMAQAIAHASPIPVVHIPHMIEVPVVTSDRASFGIEETETVFLCMFDFHSTPSRKNPAGSIEAFRLAFSPDEPVRLVVKSMNGHNRPEALRALQSFAEGLRVTFIDESLESERRYQLVASCDAFLSLHRAEGFGLGIAEAMAYGKPVVATGWSGNMDFMHVGNSYPVSFVLKALEVSDPPYEAGTVWAEPDLGHAAQVMREIWTHPARAKAVGDRAREDIRMWFSSQHIGDRIAERLQLIISNRASDEDPAANRSGEAAVPPEGRRSYAREPLRPAVRWAWRKALRLVPPRFKPGVLRRADVLKRRVGYS